MDVLTFDDVEQFAAQVAPVLQRHPTGASVLATTVEQARAGGCPGATWFLIQQGSQVIAAAMQTPPYNLFLTPLPDEDRTRAVDGVISAVLAHRLELPGVMGQVDDATAFIAAWQERTGQPPTAKGTSTRMYEITQPPGDSALTATSTGGSQRLATGADLELVTRWIAEFNDDVRHGPAVDAGSIANRRISQRSVVLWDDAGEPVSLAGVSSPHAGVSRIGPVYTPPAQRRRGYAAAATSAATRLGFARGAQRCVLYADLANPTSNSIYQAIGYRPIGDWLEQPFQG